MKALAFDAFGLGGSGFDARTNWTPESKIRNLDPKPWAPIQSHTFLASNRFKAPKTLKPLNP